MAREAAPKARARTLLAIPQTAIIGVAMNYDHEIHSLAAETLATQTILAQALFRLSQFDPGLKRAITEALNDAANIVEHVPTASSRSPFGSEPAPYGAGPSFLPSLG